LIDTKPDVWQRGLSSYMGLTMRIHSTQLSNMPLFISFNLLRFQMARICDGLMCITHFFMMLWRKYI
jgi:hypothetical protein